MMKYGMNAEYNGHHQVTIGHITDFTVYDYTLTFSRKIRSDAIIHVNTISRTLANYQIGLMTKTLFNNENNGTTTTTTDFASTF